MDEIIIKNLKIFAFHGVNPQEKETGQNFFIDAVLYADLSAPCKNDTLNDTVNYAAAVKLINAAMKEMCFDLIERAAQYVVDELFIKFDKIQKITLTLKKPEAPMKADFDYVAVKITRSRE